MASVITKVRALCYAGTADYTVYGVNYWSDDQVQAVLDRYRAAYKRLQLTPMEDYIDGAYSYTEYPLPAELENVEGTASGWALRTVDGGTVPSYTANLDAGVITFDASTGGTAYYLDCRNYDINRAAAEIWRQKAAHTAEWFDVKTDNHDLKRSQAAAHCLKMAAEFERRAGPISVQMVRSDLT